MTQQIFHIEFYLYFIQILITEARLCIAVVHNFLFLDKPPRMEKLSGRVTFVNIPRSGKKMLNIIYFYSYFIIFYSTYNTPTFTFTYVHSINRNRRHKLNIYM